MNIPQLWALTVYKGVRGFSYTPFGDGVFEIYMHGSKKRIKPNDGKYEIIKKDASPVEEANDENRLHNESFTNAEQKVINEVDGILNSQELNVLKKAAEEGKHATITINGRTFAFEPDIPSGKGFFAITNSETGGFHLGVDAFQNKLELTKTLLHELHRLEFSEVVKTGSAGKEIAKTTTNNANDFANKAYDLFFK